MTLCDFITTSEGLSALLDQQQRPTQQCMRFMLHSAKVGGTRQHSRLLILY